jgi:hypothetical protein
LQADLFQEYNYRSDEKEAFSIQLSGLNVIHGHLELFINLELINYC